MSAKKYLMLAPLFWGASASADNLDSYAAPAFSYTDQISTVESGTRYGARVDLVHIQKNVEADLRYANGLNYADFGGSLRLFQNWALTPGESLLLNLGGGLAFNYSTGVTGAGIKVPFLDPALEPFVRLIWDTHHGFGISLEGGIALIMARINFGTNPYRDETIRVRPYFTVGIPITL